MWYWVYCYAALRSLGLVEFASRLQKLVETALESLSTDLTAYGHILRTIDPRDPSLPHLAQVTALRMQFDLLPLSDQDCKVVAESSSDFAASVNRSLV